jgi:hypothetical protein
MWHNELLGAPLPGSSRAPDACVPVVQRLLDACLDACGTNRHAREKSVAVASINSTKLTQPERAACSRAPTLQRANPGRVRSSADEGEGESPQKLQCFIECRRCGLHIPHRSASSKDSRKSRDGCQRTEYGAGSLRGWCRMSNVECRMFQGRQCCIDRQDAVFRDARWWVRGNKPSTCCCSLVHLGLVRLLVLDGRP